MHPLEGVHQSWTITLLKDVAPDFHDEVRSHSQNLCIEGAVMDGAHCQSVRYDRFAAIRILLDVRGIEELEVPESAERALAPVSKKHTLAKRSLMQAHTNGLLGILAAKSNIRRMRKRGILPLTTQCFIDGHDELVLSGFLSNQPDGVESYELSGRYRHEVNKGASKLQGSSER